MAPPPCCALPPRRPPPHDEPPTGTVGRSGTPEGTTWAAAETALTDTAEQVVEG
ncbi:hypothetical protein KUM42_17555 [Modestobacter sp. L9-4]|uniref:hypothetical protein n=1 Tax=Modestobacter sp. L9-4 TaxID=2851567 RepID=UPI001C73F7C6|nr:hypothetical protein [Modestobacter sp. L9-4]QXG75591.1 hypothetical protein KUM42_17555 [Modestobacter sp. L9-4]